MKIISYLLSPIFGLVFFLVLLVFHPLQWLSLKLFGYNAHNNVVSVLNFFLVKSLLILGVSVKFDNKYKLPQNSTLIFVSNHQSMFDIPPIIWYLRKYHIKFVSKIELGKGIPSISFNLRHGGAALIDRKDAKQAISELIGFSKRLNENKWSCLIFPEGTRSNTGEPKSFSLNGVKTIIKYNPDAYIVPLSINNSWKIFKFGKFPLGLGSQLKLKVHEPIKIDSLPVNDLMMVMESTIKDSVVI